MSTTLDLMAPGAGDTGGGTTGGLTDAELRASPVPVSLTSTSISNFPASQTISGTVSVTGVATELTLSSVDSKLPLLMSVAPGSDTGQAAIPVRIISQLGAGGGGGGGLTDAQLRASPVPVSLTSTTVTNFPATQAISAASLPLPTGASTETTLSAINTKTPALGQAVMASSTPVVLASNQSSIPVTLASTTITNFPATQAVSIAATVAVSGPLTDTQLRATAVPVSGVFFQSTQPISAAALPLPSGASTSANQNTANTSLSSIDTKLSGDLKVQGATANGALGPFENPVLISGLSSSGVTGTKIIPNVQVVGTDGGGDDINALLVYDYSQGGIGAVSGTLTSGSSPIYSDNSKATTIYFEISGTWTGSITVQQELGTTSITIPVRALNSTTTQTSITANGTYIVEGGFYMGGVKFVSGVATGSADLYGLSLPASSAYRSYQAGTWSMSVSNFPATQAISAVSLPLPTGASTETTLAAINTKTPALGAAVKASSVPVNIASDQTVPVSIASMPSTPVTGPLTDTQLRATAVPVSLTSTTITNFPASQAVTGSFFQATQPVSIAATVAVSGPLTDTQLRASAVPVSGSFFQATQPISAASLPLPTGAATETTLAALNTKVTAVNTGAVVLAAGAASIGTVQQATLTKGTQGATGVSTQDLKDAGRNQTNYFMVLPVISTGTDTLMSLTGYKAGAAVVATTTPAVVTAGKTYRITKIVLNYVAIATAGTVKFTLRANTGGAVVIGSPAVSNWVIGAGAAVAGVSQTVDLAIPDGLEFAAGTGIGISMVGLSAVQAAAAVGYGQISIHGFEY